MRSKSTDVLFYKTQRSIADQSYTKRKVKPPIKTTSIIRPLFTHPNLNLKLTKMNLCNIEVLLQLDNSGKSLTARIFDQSDAATQSVITRILKGVVAYIEKERTWGSVAAGIVRKDAGFMLEICTVLVIDGRIHIQSHSKTFHIFIF